MLHHSHAINTCSSEPDASQCALRQSTPATATTTTRRRSSLVAMSSPVATPAVRTVATHTVQPPPQPRTTLHLTPWDLSMLTLHYIQNGLLYANLPAAGALPARSDLILTLKTSLAATLAHYYPFAGRLIVDETASPDGASTTVSVSVDCCGLGGQLIHAVADGITVADVVNPGADIPAFVPEFFPLNGAINIDGRSLPLFAVQVTELVDGVFVGWAYNHAVGDGVPLWNLMASWGEAARSGDALAFTPTRKPIFAPWYLEGHGDELPLKATFPSKKFIERFSPPQLRERVFRFSAASMAALKTRALQESSKEVAKVSSFEALVSLMWRCVTRARRSPPEEETRLFFTIGNRIRLTPPLSIDHFGNIMSVIKSRPVTSGELLNNGHGWAVALVAATLAGHTEEAVKSELKAWMETPKVKRLSEHHRYGVLVASSPKFDMYGVDFGFGRPVAVRSGPANKYDGAVNVYPTREGGGNVDVEVNLLPEAMAALLEDEEFLAAVSPAPPVGA